MTLTNKDRLELLWTEYQYRHEHIWKMLFQVTAAATVLASAPYLNPTIAKHINWLAVALPILATLLVAYALFALNAEIRLLYLIRARYRDLQIHALDIEHGCDGGFDFRFRVRCYIGALLLGGIAHIVVTAVYWVPHVSAMP